MAKHYDEAPTANDHAVSFRYNCLDYRSAFHNSIGTFDTPALTVEEKAWSGVLYHSGACLWECNCAPKPVSAPVDVSADYSTIEDLLISNRKIIAGQDSKIGYAHKRIHVAFTHEETGEVVWQSSCFADVNNARWSLFAQTVEHGDKQAFTKANNYFLVVSESPIDEGLTRRAEKSARLKRSWRTGLDVWEANETPPAHIWPGVKEGAFNVMPSDPGAGKTTISLHAAICTALGIEFLGYEAGNQFNRAFVEAGPGVYVESLQKGTNQGRKVVYVVAEDTWESAQPDIKAIINSYRDQLDDAGLLKLRSNFRLVVAGKDSDIHNLSDKYEREAFRDQLREFLHADETIAEQPMLIIDTLAGSFHLPDGRTMIDDATVQRHIIEPMKALCAEFGLTVLLLCHTAKGVSNRKNASRAEKASRAKNSGTIWAAARGTLYLEVVREESKDKNLLTKIIVAKQKGDLFDDLVVEIDRHTRALTVCLNPPDSERKEEAKRFISWAEKQESFTKKDANAFLTPADASPEERAKDRAKALLDRYENVGALIAERSDKPGVPTKYKWIGFEKKSITI
jgi:RecA-family ATPase